MYKKAFLTPNPNYDEAMLLYLFAALKRLAEILEKSEDAKLWQETLLKLRLLAVNENHVLRIARDEDLTESHRHQSHTMSIHPLRLLDYSKKEDARIIDATIAHAEKLGSKPYTGYSIAWIGEFYAVAKNGDKALEKLETFWKYFCSENTFHLNGDYTKQGYLSMHYRPFTLEGNFCAQDVLQELLLYSENSVLELFPAVPQKWQEVSFETLRACGGVLVSAERKNGKLFSAKFTAQANASFLFRGNFSDCTVTGGKTETTSNGIFCTMQKGESVYLQRYEA